MISNAITA